MIKIEVIQEVVLVDVQINTACKYAVQNSWLSFNYKLRNSIALLSLYILFYIIHLKAQTRTDFKNATQCDANKCHSRATVRPTTSACMCALIDSPLCLTLTMFASVCVRVCACVRVWQERHCDRQQNRIRRDFKINDGKIRSTSMAQGLEWVVKWFAQSKTGQRKEGEGKNRCGSLGFAIKG